MPTTTWSSSAAAVRVGPQAVVDGEVVTVGGDGGRRIRRPRSTAAWTKPWCGSPTSTVTGARCPAAGSPGSRSPRPSSGCSSCSWWPRLLDARRAGLGAAHLVARLRWAGVVGRHWPRLPGGVRPGAAAPRRRARRVDRRHPAHRRDALPDRGRGPGRHGRLHGGRRAHRRAAARHHRRGVERALRGRGARLCAGVGGDRRSPASRRSACSGAAR